MVQRAKRWAYIVLVGVVTTFVVGLFSVMAIETLGPTEHSDGRVIDRVEGERTQLRCGARPSRCREVTYPTYSVVGERADGSTWIAVGEGPYDAMRGERGVVGVTTSSITGRVVGLEGQDSFDADWSVAGSGIVWFSTGLLVIWVPLVVAYEWRRRSGFFGLGSFELTDVVVAVVAVAGGAAALWFAVFAKTAGLDVASSTDLYGDFLRDPLTFVAQAHDGDDEPGVAVGEFASARSLHDLATVPLHALGDAVPHAAPEGVIAAPVVQIVAGGTARFDAVTWTLVDGPDAEGGIDTIDCPEPLTTFPTTLGTDAAVVGGFVCFPNAPASADAALRLTVGHGAFANSVLVDAEFLASG